MKSSYLIGLKFFFLMCLLVQSAFAGNRTVTSFPGDFSGTATDSNRVSDGWGTVLRIDTVGTIFSSVLDASIGDALSPTSLSAQGKVKVVGDNEFKVGWFLWDQVHDGAGSNIDKANFIYISELSLDGLNTELDDNPIQVAKDEKDDTGNPPSMLDFFIDDTTNFIAYWSAFKNDAVRTSNARHRGFIGSDPASVFGVDVDSTLPNHLGGEPGFDVMPGFVAADTSTWLIALANTLTANDDGLQVVVKEVQRNILYGPDTIITSNGNPPRHLNVEVSTSGIILVSWMESPFVGGDLLGDIYVSAYNDDLTPIAAMQKRLVATNVLGRGASFADMLLSSYEVESIDDDVFVITYGNDTDVFYRTINPNANTISAAQTISDNCNRCFYPSVSLTPDSTEILFSYFGNQDTATTDTLAQVSIYDLIGSPRSVDAGSQATRTLSVRPIEFSHSYGKRIHYYGQVSTAKDNSGNIVTSFNHETKAWVNGWSNVNFYFDTAQYISGDLTIPAGFVAEPYNPALDSVQWLRAVSINDTNMSLRFQFSTNSTYSGLPVDADYYGIFPADTKTNGNHYKYSFELRSSNESRVTPLIDSLYLEWNVRPRNITIDSIQIGEYPYLPFSNDTIYPVINRLDTVRIAISGFDYDNHDTLTIAHYESGNLIDSIHIDQSVTLLPAGFYRHEIVYVPRDTVAPDLEVILNWVDKLGWASNKDTVHLNYYNIPPEDSVFITFPKGANQGDSTEQVVDGKFYRIQMGDTAFIKVVAQDSNDSRVRIRIEDTDGLILFSDSVTVVDSLTEGVPHDPVDTVAMIELPIGQIDLTVDTVYVFLEDGDVRTESRVLLVPNHNPWIDSMKTISYMLPDGSFRDSLIYRNSDLELDRGIDIIPYVPNRIIAFDRDPDEVNLDSTYVEWYLLEVDSTGACCLDWPDPITTGDTLVLGDASIYNDSLIIPMGGDTISLVGRDTILDWYLKFHRLRMVTYDVTGAFREDTVGLRYPRLDTNLTNNNFQFDLDSLLETFNIVLGSSEQQKSFSTRITSSGTAPLVISQSYTNSNQDYWLSYKLDWLDTTGTTSSVFVESQTDSTRLTPTAAVTLNQFQDLTITFNVDVSNLVGDSVIVDTLYLTTNDWFNPVLKIPIRLEYNDYPKVNVFYEPFDDRDTTYTLDSLVNEIPINGRIKFAFSEPVVESNIHRYIKIFSVPDNLSRGIDGDSLRNFIPELGSRVSRMESKFSNHYQRIHSKAPNGNTLTRYIDTLLFIPDYQTVSDSFKIRPGPESFVIGDSIHIWMSSEIRDSTGNPLDLARSALPAPQLVEDSVIIANIDASTFKVIETELRPQPRQVHPPGEPIRIPFDSKLVEWNILGPDSIFSLDLKNLDSTNKTVLITSKKSQWKPVQLKSIQLENDDSTLVIYPKRHFFSNDSLRIQVFSNLSDWKGRTLNGNFDSTYTYLFWCYDTPNRELNNLCKTGDGADTLDQFDWSIQVGESGFYSFPNPYRHYREDHREVGGIAFKNLHKIKGIVPDKPINIRVYTLNGQLVHSSKRKKRSVVFVEGADDAPQYVWNARNNHGRLVATGLYLYTVESDGEVVKKGKVAVIR